MPPDANAAPLTESVLDEVLSWQVIVAWAGETGEVAEEPRLGWWRTNLVSEFGGVDLFRRLLPATADWAVLEAARQAARRTDAAIRARDHDADRLLTLYRFGFDVDEKLDERLADHKRSQIPPYAALPMLRAPLSAAFRRETFAALIATLRPPDHVQSPAGRRLRGDAPAAIDVRTRNLVGALAPLLAEYPLPHYRVGT